MRAYPRFFQPPCSFCCRRKSLQAQMPGAHPHLSAEELQEFRELFDLVDLDHGGSISPDELGSLMETLGLKPNQDELDEMIREIDEDGNGEIEFDEFVQVMSRKVQPTFTQEQVKQAFKVFAPLQNPNITTKNPNP